jgi:hypothetical protein
MDYAIFIEALFLSGHINHPQLIPNIIEIRDRPPYILLKKSRITGGI